MPYKGIESTAKNVGESWELSAVAGNESVVANGEFAGRNIVELIKEHKADCLFLFEGKKKRYSDLGAEYLFRFSM